MDISHILYFFGAILIISFLNRFKKPFLSRHNRNIRTAKRVLKKIRAFEGNDKNARIFGYLRKIDPFVFEELLLQAFKDKGFKIRRNKRYTGDGGIDGIVFTESGHPCLIQAKRYKGYINKKHLQDFVALIQETSAYGFFIHTGKTGKGSKKEVMFNENIEVVSGQKLIQFLTDTPKDIIDPVKFILFSIVTALPVTGLTIYLSFIPPLACGITVALSVCSILYILYMKTSLLHKKF